VLEHQTFQVASDPRVQSAGCARHDVYVIILQPWNPVSFSVSRINLP
jgi:hypothetical protein